MFSCLNMTPDNCYSGGFKCCLTSSVEMGGCDNFGWEVKEISDAGLVVGVRGGRRGIDEEAKDVSGRGSHGGGWDLMRHLHSILCSFISCQSQGMELFDEVICISSLVTHSFSDVGNPFHLMRYCSLCPLPLFLTLRMASISCSSCPSIISGGGGMYAGPY